MASGNGRVVMSVRWQGNGKAAVVFVAAGEILGYSIGDAVRNVPWLQRSIDIKGGSVGPTVAAITLDHLFEVTNAQLVHPVCVAAPAPMLAM